MEVSKRSSLLDSCLADMKSLHGETLPRAWYQVVNQLASLQSTFTNCKPNDNISKNKNKMLPCVLIIIYTKGSKIAQRKPQG